MGGAGQKPRLRVPHILGHTWISSCCTTCICTRHWAVLRSSRACSVLRCLQGEEGGEERVGPGLPAITTLPSRPLSPPTAWKADRSRDTKKGKGWGNGAEGEAAFYHPPVMSLLKSQLQRDLIANELIK